MSGTCPAVHNSGVPCDREENHEGPHKSMPSTETPHGPPSIPNLEWEDDENLDVKT